MAYARCCAAIGTCVGLLTTSEMLRSTEVWMATRMSNSGKIAFVQAYTIKLDEKSIDNPG